VKRLLYFAFRAVGWLMAFGRHCYELGRRDGAEAAINVRHASK
jgi:hypothetical protein